MTSIYQKVFSRAFHSHWDHENRWRIDGDMAEWSLWHLYSEAVSVAKFVHLYSFAVLSYNHPILVFLLHHLSSLASTFYPQKKQWYLSKKKTTKFWCWQSTWLEGNYYFSLLYPPFYFPLPALWLLPPPLLCLSSAPSAFSSQYFSVLLSLLPKTLAMKIVPH